MKPFQCFLGFTVVLAVCFSGIAAEPETDNPPSIGETVWLKPESRQSALERQKFIAKLDHIRLPQISFLKLSLEEVVRQLNEAARQHDPEKIGINIFTATNAISSQWTDINSVVVNISQLSDVRLMDVLDAIVLVADKPITYSIQSDGSVFFSAKDTVQVLFSRAFRVDASTFISDLKGADADLNENTNSSATVSAAARKLFESLGVNFESPPGKSVFYNNRLGKLFVKATQEDLDKIEGALSKLQSGQPQIHIRARFVEVPKRAISGLPKMVAITNQPAQSNQPATITGILADEDFKIVLRSLQARDGVAFMAEPGVTTLSGRQTQLYATQTQIIDTNYVSQLHISDPPNYDPRPVSVEAGPILVVVPKVLPDDYTINLAVTFTVTELVGIIKATNALAGNSKVEPKLIPKMRDWQAAANVNLWDGQTIVVGGLPVTNTDISGKSAERSKANEMEMIVFVTTTIVDPAGNRVHSDDEMKTFKDKIPPQPGGK